MYGSIGGYDSDRNDAGTYSNLSETVRDETFRINTKAASLARFLKQLTDLRGASGVTKELRDQIHSLEVETNDLIRRATKNVKHLSDIARRGDKSQKIQADKLRNDFQDRVKWYSTLQQQVAVKIKQINSNVTAASKTTTSANVSTVANPFIDTDDPFNLEELERQQAQRQAQLSVEADQLAVREGFVQQLEQDILNINEIFKDLGAMVAEQGESVNTIEANIEDAYHNVTHANQDLEKAERHAVSARKKTVFCIILVIVVLIILALVIYFSVKH